jgi:hypothetical protein
MSARVHGVTQLSGSGYCMASPDLPAKGSEGESGDRCCSSFRCISLDYASVGSIYSRREVSLWLSGEVPKPSPLVAASRDPWRSACKWLILLCASSSHLGSLPHQLHTRSSPNVTLNSILDCCKSTGLEYWSRPQPPTMPEPILRRNKRLRTWRR